MDALITALGPAFAAGLAFQAFILIAAISLNTKTCEGTRPILA